MRIRYYLLFVSCRGSLTVLFFPCVPYLALFSRYNLQRTLAKFENHISAVYPLQTRLYTIKLILIPTK